MSEAEQSRAGITAIVGRPNVGKSTLLNRVLGEKLAIVSRKPQTTRNRILGIHNVDGHQVVLLDTPGIHRSRANLNKFMVQEALESIHGVDCILLLTEVRRQSAVPEASDNEGSVEPADRYVLEQIQLQAARCPIVVVINKIDLLPDRQVLLPEIASWSERGYASVVPISAQKGDGVDRLVDVVVSHLPEGPALYPEDALTDRAERFLAAELIREQVFLRCHQELPYASAVLVEEFTERERTADVWIEAVIHVERESQKGILIGKQGRMIKTIGQSAREAIGRLLGCEVHLKLTIRVEADWSKRPAGRRKLGYD
jgi:GTP-binding protein Era